MAEDSDDSDHLRGVGDEQEEVTVSSLRPDAPAGVRVPGRLWYRVIGGMMLAALSLTLAGTFIWLRPLLPVISPHASQPARLSDALTMDASRAGIVCVDGAAWSPDSHSVLLVGKPGCLGGTQPVDEALAVFDARTSAVRAHTILVAADIERAVSLPEGATWAGSTLLYAQPIWSPDGRRLVVPFSVSFGVYGGAEASQVAHRTGLCVLDSALTTNRVLPGPEETAGLDGSTLGAVVVARWDLATSEATRVLVPQALAYHWQPDGSLLATNLLPQTSDAEPPATTIGPVGNPLGGTDFTPWQQGDIVLANGAGCGAQSGTAATTYPPYYVLSVFMPAWSPDGRYLLLWVGLQARLPLSPPPALSPPTPLPSGLYPSSCIDLGPAVQLPQVPMRDAGLRTALALINGTSSQVIQLAWSPDGRRLAVAPRDVGVDSTVALIVYDCTTGRERLRLSTAEIVSAQTGPRPFSVLAWSPDGTRLLLFAQGPFPIIHVVGTKSLGG